MVAATGGTVTGTIEWDGVVGAFSARLQVLPAGFDPTLVGHDPSGPPWDGIVTIGGVTGRYLTVDGLRNGLALRGYEPAFGEADAFDRLRDEVVERWGDVSIDGRWEGASSLTTELKMTLPGGRRLGLGGDLVLDRSSRDATAPGPDIVRALVRRIWSEGWGREEELLADELHRLLRERGDGPFRIEANRLCDWIVLAEPGSPFDDVDSGDPSDGADSVDAVSAAETITAITVRVDHRQ